MKTILFACIHNAGRSQMAAAWFNALVDPKHAVGISAGTQPGMRVHPDGPRLVTSSDKSRRAPKRSPTTESSGMTTEAVAIAA